jgi:hypothetical protein
VPTQNGEASGLAPEVLHYAPIGDWRYEPRFDEEYVFAGEEVIVLDQSDWERTTTLTLGESN